MAPIQETLSFAVENVVININGARSTKIFVFLNSIILKNNVIYAFFITPFQFS